MKAQIDSSISVYTLVEQFQKTTCKILNPDLADLSHILWFGGHPNSFETGSGLFREKVEGVEGGNFACHEPAVYGNFCIF